MIAAPTVFALASLSAELVVVLAALKMRGRLYGVFASVVLTLHLLITWGLFGTVSAGLMPFFLFFHATVYVHYASLIRARMRGPAWRWIVTWPAHYFVGATLLAAPWSVAAALGFDPWLPLLPYVAAAFGVVQSARAAESEVDVVIDRERVCDTPRRHPLGEARGQRPLRIVQITDPHLGPWMSAARLRGICERAVARAPDLILLTGDFLTMESHGHPELLAEGLAPLLALEGRTFACRGNHDLEAPETVATGLASAGVRLLVDEAVDVETPIGVVQILGLDFRFRGRSDAMAQACRENPRPEGALRLVLLHDPGAFTLLPEGEGDLVLAGHTHGGQVGLVSLGMRWTPVWSWVGMPDHGLFARGGDRLYVHRGTGQYGFPLRLGVPAEESLLRVHVDAARPHDTVAAGAAS